MDGHIPGIMSVKVDGRVLRAERTRARIIGATIALVREGTPTPRVVDIAKLAGVSTRSIFQHFDDTEALFAAVAQKVVQDLLPLAKPVPPGLSLDQRLELLLSVRVRVNEELLPFRRSMAINESRSPRLVAEFMAGRELARRRTEDVFRPELAALSDAERRQTVDTMLAISDWHMWVNLRVHYGMDVETSAAAMRRLLAALIDHLARGA